MAKARTYPMEKVLAAREALRRLPVKEKEQSGARVVELLRADVRKAVKQGHSLKDIQAVLAEQGISVSLSRLASVLEQAGKKTERKKAAKPRAGDLFVMAPASRLEQENGAAEDEKDDRESG